MKFTGPATRVKSRAQEWADEITIEVEDACGGLAPGLEDQRFRPFVLTPRRHRRRRSAKAIRRAMRTEPR
jgi:C4-dicarboxylate-specific signal transduction histidine kinase